MTDESKSPDRFAELQEEIDECCKQMKFLRAHPQEHGINHEAVYEDWEKRKRFAEAELKKFKKTV